MGSIEIINCSKLFSSDKYDVCLFEFSEPNLRQNDRLQALQDLFIIYNFGIVFFVLADLDAADAADCNLLFIQYRAHGPTRSGYM